MKFIPAQWGAAKALVQLHSHTSALKIVKKALEQLPLIKVSYNMMWPGTVRCMSETLTQNVEVSGKSRTLKQSNLPLKWQKSIKGMLQGMLIYSLSIEIVIQIYKMRSTNLVG